MVYGEGETLERMRRSGNKNVFGRDIFPEEDEEEVEAGDCDDGDDDGE